MARARTIKPAFFRNEEMSECTPFARLLFIGLWTLADRNGTLEYKPKRIRAELFPYDAVNVHDLAVELHGKKFLVMYESGEQWFIHIPAFTKHQRPHPKEPAGDFPQPPCWEPLCVKAVKKHGEPEKNTASCAIPSFNPLILKSANREHSRPSREKSRFVKPTLSEVTAYCLERQNKVDPQRFLDHYESNGWKVGRNKMTDWKAAVRTWEKSDFAPKPPESRVPTDADNARWNPVDGGLTS